MKLKVTPNKQKKLMEKMAQAMSRVLASELSEDELLDMIDVYPEWKVGIEVKPNQLFKYNDKLWKVLQVHTTQADWTPDTAASLFTEVAPPDTIGVWVQPDGAHDAYDTGDKVEWPDGSGTIWQSTIDTNTTEPGTNLEHEYWVEVT